MADCTRSTARWATSTSGGDFDFVVHVHEGHVRIELFGDLDDASAPMLACRIEGLLGRIAHLEIDLTHLQFLGAAGVGAFVRAANGLPAAGTMALVFPSRGVLRVLDIVTLPPCVRIHRSEPGAAPSHAPGRRTAALSEA